MFKDLKRNQKIERGMGGKRGEKMAEGNMGENKGNKDGKRKT